MSDFSNEVESEEIRAELLDAIHGAGPFRNFKAAVRRRRIEDEWYKFRAANPGADRNRLVRGA